MKLKHVQSEISRHGKRVYYYRVGNSPRIRLPDSYGSNEFLAAVDLAARSRVAAPREPFIRPSFTRDQKRHVGRSLEIAVKGARQRSSKKKLAFDIDISWALEQAARQNFRCRLTGISFYMPTASTSYRHPYAPSLDRIDPCGGYTKDNVRIVIFAINVMLMDWGQQVFERVMSGFRFTKGTKAKLLFPPKMDGAGMASKNRI